MHTVAAKAAVPGLRVEGASSCSFPGPGMLSAGPSPRPRCREPPSSDGCRRLAEALSERAWRLSSEGPARTPPAASVVVVSVASPGSLLVQSVPGHVHWARLASWRRRTSRVNVACCVCLVRPQRTCLLTPLLPSFPRLLSSLPPSGTGS